MNKQQRKKFVWPPIASAVIPIVAQLALLPGCRQPPGDRAQGYVEGEYVYIASPIGGQIVKLSVERGTEVAAGAPLFALDDTLETAARDEANRNLAVAQANLEDARKGKRPTEIESIQAQLDQARVSLEFSAGEFARVEALKKTGAVSQQQFDQDRMSRDQAQQHVTELEADLKTAGMGQRSDQIAAAEAQVKAKQAALAQAQWNLSQKHQNAPMPAAVFDTLYRQGEWVPAGRPVVSLLPPPNIKVRAFVAEGKIGQLHLGDAVQVTVDGAANPLAGKISFISPRAEYTPPVIYSRESRGKLVFMVEIVFAPETAAKLHPGQPVDVQFGAP